MLKEISEKLNGFIGEETGLSRNKSFSANTRLAEELGLSGDEASDFMVKFFKNFGVKVGISTSTATF